MSDDPMFHDQSHQGDLFRNNNKDYFVYRTTSVAIEYLAFRLELFAESTDVPRTKENQLERFALAYCMPSSMSDTFGFVSIPILAKSQQPIGKHLTTHLTT
jgi:hypothetical protein